MSRVLTANMLGTANDSGQIQVTPNIAVEDYIAWTTGHLVFRNTPVHEAIQELSRVYGMELRVTDSSLAKQPLTWTIPVTQRSLTDVLESLTELLGAHTIRTGHTITLVPGRSAFHHPAGLRLPFSRPSSEPSYGK